MQGKSILKFKILIVIFGMTLITSVLFKFFGFSFSGFLSGLVHHKFFPLIYIALFIISSFFPLPFLTFLGAVFFNFWVVLFLSLVGNMFAFSIMFFLAKWLGRDYVEKYQDKNPWAYELDFKFNERPFRNMILLRFFYLIPPEFVNLFGGISRMKFKDYFISSSIGVLPVSLAAIILVKSKLVGSYSLFILGVGLHVVLLLIPLIYISSLRIFIKDKSRKMYKDGKRLRDRIKDFKRSMRAKQVRPNTRL